MYRILISVMPGVPKGRPVSGAPIHKSAASLTGCLVCPSFRGPERRDAVRGGHLLAVGGAAAVLPGFWGLSVLRRRHAARAVQLLAGRRHGAPRAAGRWRRPADLGEAAAAAAAAHPGERTPRRRPMRRRGGTSAPPPFLRAPSVLPSVAVKPWELRGFHSLPIGRLQSECRLSASIVVEPQEGAWGPLSVRPSAHVRLSVHRGGAPRGRQGPTAAKLGAGTPAVTSWCGLRTCSARVSGKPKCCDVRSYGARVTCWTGMEQPLKIAARRLS
jgi:hypothetical protein